MRDQYEPDWDLERESRAIARHEDESRMFLHIDALKAEGKPLCGCLDCGTWADHLRDQEDAEKGSMIPSNVAQSDDEIFF